MPRTPDYTGYGFSDTFNEIPSQQRDQKGLGTVPFMEITVFYGFYGIYGNSSQYGFYSGYGIYGFC